MAPRTKVTSFTPVILFAHREPEIDAHFTRLHLENGGHITLSPNHLIFTGIGRTEMADRVLVDDKVFLSSGEVSKVTAIEEEVIERGFFCPGTQFNRNF